MTSEEIRAIRKALKMTQGGLATALGYNRSYINQVELGRKKPGKKLLLALAKLNDPR